MKSRSKSSQSTTRSTSKAPRKYRHAQIKQPTWQNPLIEYFDAKRSKIVRKYQKAPKRVRLERQILAMLAFFSISIGLWENFRQLWLQQNGFSAPEVSNIISFGMVLSVAGVILVGKFVKMQRIKFFMTTTLVVRSIGLVLMYFLNGTGLTPLIVALSALEVVTGCLIVTSVYPLLTTVMKSNNTYSRRKLVEYLFRDVGVLVGAVLIGQQFGKWIVDYNTCLMVSAAFATVSAVIMGKFQLELTERIPSKEHFSALKYAMGHKIHRIYMVYVFLAGAAYQAAIGLRMLVLTDFFELSAGMATTYLLIVGLLSDVIGMLALRYFTPKNDYASLFIKFGTRFFLFTAAFITGNFFLCFLSLTWTLLSSTAYENVSDGYYINSVDNRYQLKYNTLKYVVNYSGDAVGVFLCGQMFQLGPGYIFGMSALLIVVQLAAAFRLIYERKKYGFNRK